MNLKSKVDKLEQRIDEAKPGMNLDDLLSLPWDEEQVEKFEKNLPAEGKLEIEQVLNCFDEDYRAEVIEELRKGLGLEP